MGRIDMHTLQEFVSLARIGTGFRTDARTLRISPNTEREYRKVFEAEGLLPCYRPAGAGRAAGDAGTAPAGSAGAAARIQRRALGGEGQGDARVRRRRLTERPLGCSIPHDVATPQSLEGPPQHPRTPARGVF